MLYTRPFLAIFLVSFFSTCNVGAFFLFPLFVAERGGTAADIGYIMGIYSLASVFSRPLVSEIINRLGRKRAYSVANLTMVMITLVYLCFSGSLADFYAPLLLVRVIHGISGGLAFTTGFTYAADIIPKERMNEGLGMYGVSGLLGFAIGPVFAEMVINHFGFSTYFIAAATPPAIGIIVLLFLPESYVLGGGQKAGSFLGLLRRPKILIVAILFLILAVGVSSTNSFVALFAQSRGISFVSAFFFAYSISAIVTRLLGGRMADKLGENSVIPYALAVCGTGLFILIFMYHVLILFIAGLISGAAHGILFPSLNTMALRDEPADLRAKILAIATGAFDLGVFTGAIVMGQIGKYFGFPAIFIMAGIGFFAGIVIFRLGPFSKAAQMGH